MNFIEFIKKYKYHIGIASAIIILLGVSSYFYLTQKETTSTIIITPSSPTGPTSQSGNTSQYGTGATSQSGNTSSTGPTSRSGTGATFQSGNSSATGATSQSGAVYNICNCDESNSSCKCDIYGEGLILSFPTPNFVDNINIFSPVSTELSKMPLGLTLLGSNNSGNTWSVLWTKNNISWTSGKNSFPVNTSTPYTIFGLVITTLSTSNFGLIGHVELTSGNSKLTKDLSLYDTINSGTYISYPGFKFEQMGGANFTVSYTPRITTVNGPITVDNAQYLVYPQLPEYIFGILPNTPTYSGGKPNVSAPLFKNNYSSV